MEVYLLVAGVNWQLNVFFRHVQAASFGVDGSVDETAVPPIVAGQAGYELACAELLEGVFSKLTPRYWVLRLSNSVVVVTVVPETVTIPNSPAAL